MANDKFEVGDWVEFTEARTLYKDLQSEEDWSSCNGLIGVVVGTEDRRKIEVRAIFGKWPSANPTPALDRRHFKVCVKNSEIVLDAPLDTVLDSAHAPQEDQQTGNLATRSESRGAVLYLSSGEE